MRNSSSSSAQNRKNSFSNSGGGKMVLKRGPWTAEEDELLTRCINKEGEGKWRTLPERAGLARCGKSCRLRWMNYLRPSVKRGQIAPDEEDLILRLHRLLGNRWSLIAGRIPGRTDNEIKNYWNTHLSKKLISQGIDPKTHKPLLETTSTAAGSKSGKKSDDSSSSKKAITTHTHQSTTTAPTTSSAPNPNMNLYSGSVEEDGFEEDQDRQTVGELAGCYGDHGASNVEGYHVNLRPERSSSQADQENIDGGMINCEGMVEDDGVFSSFLNSLINDDMFV